MRGKWTALAMATAMVFLLATGGLAAKVLFEDKFTTLDPSWAAPSDQINAKDGKLVITPPKNTTNTYLNQANILPNDAEIDFTLTFVKAGDPTYGSGLVYWAKDYDSWYSLLINANGWFAVTRNVGGNRILIPVAWRESDAIKKGEGQENQVKVVTKGNQAAITINGKDVITFSGQPPEGGSIIGVRVASGPAAPNTAAFSNFQVVQP